jgi:hypothetical protein
MVKWNLPPEPVPSWLDKMSEVTYNPPKLSKKDFILQSLKALIALGCSIEGAFGVLANSINETGWGQSYRAFNLGGWKMYKPAARDAQGRPRRWWRAPGNKAPGATPDDLKGGDPPWCYYRAFDSLEEYYRAWLNVYVPKANPGDRPNGRYWRTGQQFWAGEPWFDDLIAAGYKGENTQARPEHSLAEHASIVRTLTLYWAQYLLGVDPDGVWGPGSERACRAYQRGHALPETGYLDQPTRELLFKRGV